MGRPYLDPVHATRRLAPARCTSSSRGRRVSMPDEDGPGDDAVADVQLGHPVDPGDRADVPVIQPVPGVQGQPARDRLGPGRGQGVELAAPARRRRRRRRTGPCAARRPPRPARRDASTCAGSGSMNRLTSRPASRHRATASATRSNCPTTSSPPSVVSSARRSGTSVTWSGRDLDGDRDDLRLDRHLQVEPDPDRLAEEPQVAVLDVPPVLPEVDGDPVGPPEFGRARRPRPGRARGPPGPGGGWRRGRCSRRDGAWRTPSLDTDPHISPTRQFRQSDQWPSGISSHKSSHGHRPPSPRSGKGDGARAGFRSPRLRAIKRRTSSRSSSPGRCLGPNFEREKVVDETTSSQVAAITAAGTGTSGVRGLSGSR